MKIFGFRDIADDDAVRQARLQAARGNPAWEELDEIDLVAREHGLLVSAETDQICDGVGTVVATIKVIADNISGESVAAQAI